jgi:hypothetical protein
MFHNKEFHDSNTTVNICYHSEIEVHNGCAYMHTDMDRERKCIQNFKGKPLGRLTQIKRVKFGLVYRNRLWGWEMNDVAQNRAQL